ncbi:dihydrofolate reductase family protein [Dyadobacter sp. MSC1_007]|jgi:dihydrofolate reductase|uniref:dihydrofolate reductase family protein n=1 Tax=Dyadobacter sp. MSC1_007 TaxID=2909264 RepID=UPI00202F3FEB|nr:dihydrofolate reductase family protein [Dyadobacter sp. MSC1_007]
MRKLKLQVQMSIDGFISGPNGEMDWLVFNWSDDIKKYVDEITKPVDTILLGKNLATGFIPHWAAVAADETNPEKEAGIIYSTTHKVVFSKTLTKSEWENTIVENGNYVDEINALKQQTGGDMIVYGGSQFVSSLIKEGLIDELHLFINPAILGKGMPIFQEIQAMQKMNLISSKHFECGIIVAVYKPLQIE